MTAATETEALSGLLPCEPESREHLAARAAALAAYRSSSDAASEALDHCLLGRVSDLLARKLRLERKLGKVEEIQAELRALVERNRSLPLFPGTFSDWVETPLGRLAEVHHGGGRRLVEVDQHVATDRLGAGDTVFLGPDRDLLVGVAQAGPGGTGSIATVERVLEDGRLSLRDGDTPVLARRAPALAARRVAAGDSVRWQRDLMLALEYVETGAQSDLFVTEQFTAESAPRLGGLDAAVEQAVSLFTLAIAHRELAERYELVRGNTLLLHGPPGNGKTSIARATAAALSATTGEACRFAAVKGAQLESPWVGTTQRNVRELFRDLNRDPRPTVLFIDEVDAIGRSRGEPGGHHNDKFLAAWLTEIDGLVARRGTVGIIAATNRKDLVDQALLDRLTGSELHVGRPDLDAARAIFDVHLPVSLPYGPNGAEAAPTRAELVEIAVTTLYGPNADNGVADLRLRDGSTRRVHARDVLSGRTIEHVCLGARRRAFGRHADGGDPGVRAEDVEAAVADALDRLASTLSPANARTMLGETSRDLDAVAVEPLRRVAMHRYLHRATYARP